MRWKSRSGLEKFLLILFVLATPPLSYFFIGWINTHTFWGGIWVWLVSGEQGPMMAFAEIDFLVLQAGLGVSLIVEIVKSKKHNSWWFYPWCTLFLFCPSVGFLTYVLFLRRANAKAA